MLVMFNNISVQLYFLSTSAQTISLPLGTQSTTRMGRYAHLNATRKPSSPKQALSRSQGGPCPADSDLSMRRPVPPSHILRCGFAIVTWTSLQERIDLNEVRTRGQLQTRSSTIQCGLNQLDTELLPTKFLNIPAQLHCCKTNTVSR
jgi:hypothetical protein